MLNEQLMTTKKAPKKDFIIPLVIVLLSSIVIGYNIYFLITC